MAKDKNIVRKRSLITFRKGKVPSTAESENGTQDVDSRKQQLLTEVRHQKDYFSNICRLATSYHLYHIE